MRGAQSRQRSGDARRSVPNLVRMIEQCTAGCAANGNIPGLIYRSLSNDLFVSGQNLNYILNWRFNVSYVTGSHSFKAGYASNLLGDLRRSNMAPNNMDFRVNNGVPNQITMYVNQFQQDLWMRDDGYFAQENWTHKRLTLQGAVRFDHAISWAPEQQEGLKQGERVLATGERDGDAIAVTDHLEPMDCFTDLAEERFFEVHVLI